MTTHSGNAGAGVWDAAHRSLTIGLVLTVSMAAFESLAVATALPAVVRDIGGIELYGWTFSGFMLTNLLGITVTGRAADRRGVAQPFVAGTALFVSGLLGAGFAPSMAVIVASRVAQGLGAGAISSVAYVIVARGYAANARPRMLAMLSSAWVVPGLIGPALAGAIADHLHWRWVFLGLAPLAAAAAALVVPSLRRLTSAGATAAEADNTLAALGLAAGTGLALFGLGLASIPLAGLCLVAGLGIGVPALQRLMPDGTLRARAGLPAAIATVGLLSFAFFGAEAFLPLTLTEIRGQSTTMAGLALTAATLSWTTGAWIQARLAHRRSRRGLALSGLVVTLIGIAGLATVLLQEIPVACAVLTWGLAGLGMGVAYTTTTLVVLESAAAGAEGAASAAINVANVLGAALGTGIGGAVLAVITAAGHSTALAIALVDVATVAAAAMAILAARGIAEPPGRSHSC